MKNGFLSFVKKETLHIVRDVRTMVVVLLIPMLLMVLFGFAISTDINNIDAAVVAPDRSYEVNRAVERLSQNPTFTFKGYIGHTEVEEMLRCGEVDAVAVFADDWERTLQQHAEGIPTAPALQMVLDASNTNLATAAATYMQNILPPAVSHSLFETHLLYNPQMRSSYNFVSGIIGLIFILICAMMTSVSIVREKEMGTMEVLLVSPVRPIWIIVAKMIPYMVLSCINLVSVLLIAGCLLDVPMSGGVASIIAVSIIYVILALALGMLISTMADSQIVALLISAVVMLMPIMMLSGMVFPIENMPDVLQAISCIVPARWYIAAMRKLMIEGLTLSAVITEVSILAAMTLAVVAVALKRFNDKL